MKADTICCYILCKKEASQNHCRLTQITAGSHKIELD